jgi:hypothetical protein
MRESNILCHRCSSGSPMGSLWCSSLIITALWMMDLETLLKVQVGLLHPFADGPHFQLHGGHGLLYGGHRYLHIANPPLKSSKSLHNLRKIYLRLRWWDSVRG